MKSTPFLFYWKQIAQRNIGAYIYILIDTMHSTSYNLNIIFLRCNSMCFPCTATFPSFDGWILVYLVDSLWYVYLSPPFLFLKCICSDINNFKGHLVLMGMLIHLEISLSVVFVICVDKSELGQIKKDYNSSRAELKWEG